MAQNILIVTNSSWNIHNFRKGLINTAEKRDYAVNYAAPEDSYAKFLNPNYIPIITKGFFAFIFRDFFLFFQLFKLYRSLKSDIVLHFTIKMNIYGTLAAKLNKIPCINTIPGLGSIFIHKHIFTPIVLFLYNITQRYAKKICFYNKDDKNFFLQKGIVTPSQIEMIPGSGIDTDKFKPYRKLKKSNNPFTFLLFSRMLWDKGIKEYVEAARLILRNNNKIKFHLLGFLNCDNPYAIKDKNISKWEKDGIINYLGETDNVIPYIDESNCIVLPSYREGLSKSLLEALSMEKPIITTDVAGCRDVVDDEVNGFLCKPKDALDLADKMQKMLNLPGKERIKMGKNGRKKVIEQFNEEIIVSKYLKIIETVLAIDNAKEDKITFS